MVDVPGYVDTREVGKGGSARVYSGTCEQTGRVVALKVFSVPGVDRRRIHRELRALQRLSGIPHVVQMLAVATAADGSPVVVMPFLPTTMSARIGSGGVTPEKAIEWMTDIATALDQAALLDVHHRDVKPANILIDDDDKAHLADFGIAALTEMDTGTTTASAFSPPYAAPERFDGRTDVDPLRGDIYSLAATTWAAIVGEAPFGTTTSGGVSGLIGRIMANHLDRPAAVPDALYRVLRTGMALDPDARHPTATTLAAAARAALIDVDAGIDTDADVDVKSTALSRWWLPSPNTTPDSNSSPRSIAADLPERKEGRTADDRSGMGPWWIDEKRGR